VKLKTRFLSLIIFTKKNGFYLFYKNISKENFNDEECIKNSSIIGFELLAGKRTGIICAYFYGE
jgi:hypothetical protein